MFPKPAFGSNTSGFGSFNTSTTAASPFGGFKPTTGTSAFGAPPAFGANATAQPATGGGLFGSTNTAGSLFGNTAAAPAPAFGNTSGSFGFGASTSAGGLFASNTSTGLFGGTQNATAFGAKPAGFGFGSTATTAPTTGGLFGAAPSTGTGLFGGQTNTMGGGGLFSNTTGAFGQQQNVAGTAHVKYSPVVGTDVVIKAGASQNINIKHHCITCMKEYENKSLEELRLEDYTAGRKGSTAGVFGGFQQPTDNKPLFGGSSEYFKFFLNLMNSVVQNNDYFQFFFHFMTAVFENQMLHTYLVQLRNDIDALKMSNNEILHFIANQNKPNLPNEANRLLFSVRETDGDAKMYQLKQIQDTQGTSKSYTNIPSKPKVASFTEIKNQTGGKLFSFKQTDGTVQTVPIDVKDTQKASTSIGGAESTKNCDKFTSKDVQHPIIDVTEDDSSKSSDSIEPSSIFSPKGTPSSIFLRKDTQSFSIFAPKDPQSPPLPPKGIPAPFTIFAPKDVQSSSTFAPKDPQVPTTFILKEKQEIPDPTQIRRGVKYVFVPDTTEEGKEGVKLIAAPPETPAIFPLTNSQEQASMSKPKEPKKPAKKQGNKYVFVPDNTETGKDGVKLINAPPTQHVTTVFAPNDTQESSIFAPKDFQTLSTSENGTFKFSAPTFAPFFDPQPQPGPSSMFAHVLQNPINIFAIKETEGVIDVFAPKKPQCSIEIQDSKAALNDFNKENTKNVCNIKRLQFSVKSLKTQLKNAKDAIEILEGKTGDSMEINNDMFVCKDDQKSELKKKYKTKFCLISCGSRNNIFEAAQKSFGYAEICHFITDGGIEKSLKNIDKILEKLSKKDYCIIFVGENDFEEKEDYTIIVNFIKTKLEKYKNTNIIICLPILKQTYTNEGSLFNKRIDIFTQELVSNNATHKYAYIFDSNKNIQNLPNMYSEDGTINNQGLIKIFEDLVTLIKDISESKVRAQSFSGFTSKRHQLTDGKKSSQSLLFGSNQ